MIIKVCGMRDGRNIREAEQLAIHWMGFIFWPKSSRFVASVPNYLPRHISRVGVFVDASQEDVARHIEDYRLDIVQLHGHESPSFCASFRHVKVMKAFNIATAGDLLQTRAYEGSADYFLFDTKGKAVGGNGEKFDWSVLSAYNGQTPFLLSGGIGPDDAARVSAFRHPQCIGIDLNSRFETVPGLKDIKRLNTFIHQLNSNE